MHPNLLGLALGLPLTPPIFKWAYQFFLFCIHRDDRLAPLLPLLHRQIDELELCVAVRVRFSFLGLAVALQTVARDVQQSSHGSRTDPMSHATQFLRQMGGALTGPAQGGFRVTSRQRLYQPF